MPVCCSQGKSARQSGNNLAMASRALQLVLASARTATKYKNHVTMFLEQLQMAWRRGGAVQMGFAGCKKKPSVYAPLGCAGSLSLSFSQLCILLAAKWQNEDRNGCESRARVGKGGVCVISAHCAKSRGL